MKKMLHISDIHLEAEFSSNNVFGFNYFKRREEIWRTFEKILEYSKDENVEIVLISGDIYENHYISVSALDRLAYLLNSYSDIKFFITLGNHDHISSNSKYLKTLLNDNVHIFDNKLDYKEVDNIRIYGFSWDRLNYNIMPFEFSDLDYNYTNILLLHGMDSKNSEYLPIDIKLLEYAKFDYVGLGHIHIPKKVGNNIYYAGSIEPMSFNNLGPHGGNLISITNNELNVEFIDFAKRTYEIIDVDISHIDENITFYEFVTDKLKDYSKETILRLNLIGNKNKSLNIKQLENILRSKFEHFEVIDSTNTLLDINNLIEKNRDNIIGKYFLYVIENYSDREKQELINLGLKSFLLEDKYDN